MNVVKTEVTETKTWLQTHERLIVTVLVLLSCLFVANKVLNHQAEKDQQAATAATQALQLQKETDKTLAAQVEKIEENYNALIARMTEENHTLAAATSQRTIVLQQQQAADKTLPLPDLAGRWSSLTKTNPSDISLTAEGKLNVSTDTAYATVVQLEEIPVLQANLADSQKQTGNLQQELTASSSLITSQKDQISGLTTTLDLQDKSCKTQITALKAEARKGKLHSFLYGVGVGAGVVAGVVIHAVI